MHFWNSDRVFCAIRIFTVVYFISVIAVAKKSRLKWEKLYTCKPASAETKSEPRFEFDIWFYAQTTFGTRTLDLVEFVYYSNWLEKNKQIGTNMRDKFNDLIVISKSFPFKRSIHFFDSSLFWFGFWFIYEFIADVSCFRACYFHFWVILNSQCGSIIVVCVITVPVYTQEFVNSNKLAGIALTGTIH